MASAPSRRFCLMTEGRSGSTSLMEAIECFDDVAVPKKNLEWCPDNELLHPQRVRDYTKEFSKICGRRLRSPDALIDAFYEHNEGTPYVGFKCMPSRHGDYAGFVTRRDIQFLTLRRRDVASTAASLSLAKLTGSWRRHGEPRSESWSFDPARDGERVRKDVSYIHESHRLLDGIAGAIALCYEDLCDPAYEPTALDEFFGRPIRLHDPKPPTSGSTYVENWDAFRGFVEEAWSTD